MANMVPAAMSHNKAWEELVSTKNSALAAWRFETGSMLEENNSVSGDAWLLQASQRDMQSLTMALQRELCSQSAKNNGNCYEFQAPPGSSAWTGSEWKCKSESEVSSESGAKGDGDGEGGGLGIESRASLQSQDKRSNGLSSRVKVNKRRSRAANKTPITFLNADPANFRAMVQQVTGVPINPNATRLWSSSSGGVAMPGLVRPEPKRASSSAATATATAVIQGLPTLDTSAIFIAACGGASGNLNNAFSPPPPPLVRTTAPAEDSFITEKLRAACMQSFIKNGGGGGGVGAGNGFVVADQNQGLMNFMSEADFWFNNNVDELSGSVL